MKDPRIISSGAVLRECFWGDYRLTAREMLNRLEEEDAGFERFVFSKIVENSGHPSRHIRALFPPEKWRILLDRHLKTGRKTKRIRLIAANLTGDFHLAEEYAWRT